MWILLALICRSWEIASRFTNATNNFLMTSLYSHHEFHVDSKDFSSWPLLLEITYYSQTEISHFCFLSKTVLLKVSYGTFSRIY